MGINCSTGNRAKKGGGCGKAHRRTVRRRLKKGGGCGCVGTNASSTQQYGGYKYSRKASLASRKRLSERLSRHKKHTQRKTRRHAGRKRRRKHRRTRRTRRRRR